MKSRVVVAGPYGADDLGDDTALSASGPGAGAVRVLGLELRAASEPRRHSPAPGR